MEKSKFMNETLKTTIKKTITENKSKPIKKNTLLNGKKEFKSLPKLIPMVYSKLKSKTENQKPTMFSNGLSLVFMENLILNFIGLISNTKFLKRIKAKTLGKEWERLTQAMQEKNKGSRQKIFLRLTRKLQLPSS